MTIRAAENHRQVGQNRVKGLARKRESGGIALDHLEPQLLVAGMALEARGHPGLEFLRCDHDVAKAALGEFLRALGRMSVRVDDARQHDPPAQVDRAGSRSYPCAYLLIRADRDNRMTAYRQALRHAALRIF